jgi:hypothetical protein
MGGYHSQTSQWGDRYGSDNPVWHSFFYKVSLNLLPPCYSDTQLIADCSITNLF